MQIPKFLQIRSTDFKYKLYYHACKFHVQGKIFSFLSVWRACQSILIVNACGLFLLDLILGLMHTSVKRKLTEGYVFHI